jgi:hypothetical protein
LTDRLYVLLDLISHIGVSQDIKTTFYYRSLHCADVVVFEEPLFRIILIKFN